MYFLLGISLALALLLIFNLAAAVATSAMWRIAATLVGRLSTKAQAQIIFGLRILPVAASVVFVIAFVVPAYVLYEPESSGEIVSIKLALISLASLLAIGIAFFRVFRTWGTTRRLAANWLAGADPITIVDVNVPVYRIEHAFPVIAVIGIFRPRMFVASQVLDSLDEQEFRAAIAHEYGHLTANDNFKRTLLRICSDLLVFPIGKKLDNAWAENAESVADEYAAMADSSTALYLASALVKIARIVPTHAGPAMPAGAYLIGEPDVDITSRVRRLISLSERNKIPKASRWLGLSPAAWLWAVFFTFLIVLPIADQRVLASIHGATERVVNVLQ